MKKDLNNTTELKQVLLSIVGNAPFGIITIDFKGLIILINQQAAEILDLSKAVDKYIDRKISELFEHGSEFSKMINICIEEGRKEFDIDEEAYKDKILLIKARLFINGMVISIDDITERKKSEQLTRESALKLKEAQSLAKMGNWELDLITNKLYWSDEIFRIHNIDPGEFEYTYEAYLETIHPDDRNFVQDIYKNVGDIKPYYLEYRILSENDAVKFIREIFTPELGENDDVILLKGTIQDITELKKVQNELLKLNTELEERVKQRTLELENEKAFTDNVINSLPGVFYTINEKRKLTRWNKNYQELTGLSTLELQKNNVIDSIAEEDRESISSEFQKVLVEGFSSTEGKLFGKDGIKVPHVLTFSLVSEGEDNYIVGMGIDITDLKNTQARLVEINDELSDQKTELQMFNNAMLDREMRIIELKEEVNKIALELNLAPPYPAVWDEEKS